MPIFEYKCPVCGKIFEELVRSCDVQVECPECKVPAQRSYSGKIYTSLGKQGGGCSGNCSTCGGCGK